MRPDRDSGATAQWSNVHQLREAQAPEGVRVERCSTCDTFIGTAQALVAAGLVRPDQLPGQPGRPKVSARYDAEGALIGRHARPVGGASFLRINRTGRDCFRVVRYPSAPEVAQRREAERLQWAAEEARATVERLESKFGQPDDFRELARDNFDLASRMLMNACGNGKSAPMPLRFSDSALTELSALLSRMRLVVENGAIVPNPDFEWTAAPAGQHARPALHVVRS